MKILLLPVYVFLIYFFLYVDTVKVHTVTTGQTFGADEDLLRQVTNGLHVKRTNQQESDIIIVFCPISSRVGSDVEAAMREVSGNVFYPLYELVDHSLFLVALVSSN